MISTGTGANEVVYNISLDSPGAAQTDFFSISLVPTYHYVFDVGTFTVSPFTVAAPALTSESLDRPAAAPEPAAWAMMLVGVVGVGAAMRTRRHLAAL